jgi:hypothetical protein
MKLYEEFFLQDSHPLVTSLTKLVTWAKSCEFDKNIKNTDCEDQCSSIMLEKRMSGEVVRAKAKMARFDFDEAYDFSEVEKESNAIYRERTGDLKSIQVPVAKTYYPAGGCLGWHLDDKGGRLYSTWASGKSFFRYRNPDTGEIITSWDKPNAWTFRIFDFDPERPLWHCVESEDLRISVGYKFTT